jgi:uncharacterized protein YaaR (DUF327 family)
MYQVKKCHGKNNIIMINIKVVNKKDIYAIIKVIDSKLNDEFSLSISKDEYDQLKNWQWD